MPQYPYIQYQNPFAESVPMADTLQPLADSLLCDSVVPSFITQGFGRAVTPLPRVTYDILNAWNLVAIALVLLLIVLNKQLYPRQFRQVLGVPGGVAHTNQLLREWSPVGSFLGWSFFFAYLLIMSLFVQKSFVICSRDLVRYNTTQMFGVFAGLVSVWILLRFAILYFVNWLFNTDDTVDRQMTVQLSVSTYEMIAMLPLLLLLLYNPYSMFVWIGVAIIAVAAFMRFVMELVETRISTKNPPLYIFLYFCALEIAPVATLLTASLRYFGHGSVFLS